MNVQWITRALLHEECPEFLCSLPVFCHRITVDESHALKPKAVSTAQGLKRRQSFGRVAGGRRRFAMQT